MPDLLKRLAAPLIVAFLILLTIVSMLVDRRALAEGGRELPWWQALVLEVTAPVERVVSAPVDGVRDFFSSYVDLLGVKAENRRLERRIAQFKGTRSALTFSSAKPSCRADISPALPRCATRSRSRCCLPKS